MPSPQSQRASEVETLTKETEVDAASKVSVEFPTPTAPEFRSEWGHLCEQSVSQFLLRQSNRRLLAKNYRSRYGEIDLIFEERTERTHGQCQVELVFVEVRARRSPGVHPLETVTPGKRNRIEATARCFLLNYVGEAQSLRFDVVVGDGVSWTHFPHAWSP